MKVRDFLQLKKIMELTFSENDAEALAAIRRAGKVLRDHGLTWDRILSKTVTIIAEFEPDPERPPRPEDSPKQRALYDELLDDAERSANEIGGSAIDFVASVRHHWDIKGWLSKPQVEALKRVRDDAGERRRR